MLLRIRNQIINTDQIIEARYSVSRKKASELWMSHHVDMAMAVKNPEAVFIGRRLDIVFAPGTKASHKMNLTGEEAEEWWRALCALSQTTEALSGSTVTPDRSTEGGVRPDSETGQGEKA